jgi:hypothetical protein
MDEATYQILHYSKMCSPFFLSFGRISPSSLQILSSFFSFLLLNHGTSSYEVSPLLLFNPCPSFFLFLFLFLSFFFSLFFLRILLLLGRDSTHWNFLENHMVNRIKVGTRNDKGLIWSLWNAGCVMPFSIRIGHYQA